MFKRNEGTLDRIVRLGVGLVFLPAGLFWLGALQGNILGLVAALLGTIGPVTSITDFCPTYVLVGVSTLGTEKKHSPAT